MTNEEKQQNNKKKEEIELWITKKNIKRFITWKR